MVEWFFGITIMTQPAEAASWIGHLAAIGVGWIILFPFVTLFQVLYIWK